MLGKRCEQLMRAAEKEVEQLERKAREQAGLPVDPGEDGKPLPPIELPEISVMREQMRVSRKKKVEAERHQLAEKAAELEGQMKEVQDRLKALNESGFDLGSPTRETSEKVIEVPASEKENHRIALSEKEAPEESMGETEQSNDKGATGPDGDFVEFPPYDGTEVPKDPKKAFTHFCLHTRREVKASLDPSERKKKVSCWHPVYFKASRLGTIL